MASKTYRLGAGMLLPPIRRRGSPAALADRIAAAIADADGWCLPTEGGQLTVGRIGCLRCRISRRSLSALLQAAEHPRRRPRGAWCWVGDTENGAVLLSLHGHLQRTGDALLLIGSARLRPLEGNDEL